MRPVLIGDTPWLHGLFKKRYPNTYDWHTTDVWICHTVLNNPLSIYLARTNDAFVLANILVMPWRPGHNECHIVTICADDNAGWQVIKLLRASIEWARKRNCANWKISSDITDYDVSALARRVGAREAHPRFELNLRGGET